MPPAIESPVLVRVFFDTSVILSGLVSSSGASFILLQLVGLTLLDGRISEEVVIEAQRNVQAKLPVALPQLRVLLSDVMTKGAALTAADLGCVAGLAHEKDVPILASAVAQGCRYLVTLNERDFWPRPDTILVVRPGELVQRLRQQMAEL